MLTTLHIIAVSATLLIVLYADEQGLLWFLGKKPRLEDGSVRFLHIGVSIGIALVLLTGGFLFLDRASYLLGQPIFLIKMVFVAALVINGFFIGSISSLATQKQYRELAPRERRALLISGGMSALGWTGAVLCGLVLAN